MHNDTTEPFWFPAIGRKKVTAAFDGGRLTSDGGVMLLAAAERCIGIAHRLAGLIADPRNPLLVTHSVVDILRARMLAIACGYEDADDLDHLRTDPGFKLACGRLPDTGDDLCSQPTMSRWENAPSLREVVRMTYAMMIDAYCASYPRPPVAVTLDIDDTVDVVHGHQQLSLFNAHYDERCFLPIHVYETATSRPVAVLLRPDKTQSGNEVRRHLRRLVRRIRSHWPTTRLTIRGDGHYSRPEVMAWCQLASDRTSCRSALANQVRLVLHTAAYWLMLTVRDVIAKPHPLATAEFTTLRMRLLKIAGRITETATRVRVAFAAACPDAALFHGIAISLQPAGP